jgi:retron-type reverse transcriptase
MQGSHVKIKINDQVGQNFQTKKDLQQGDPLSPLLFNIVVDMLAILINRAKREGYINGVVPHLVDEGLSILQYVHDTIIFLDHDLERAKNLKLLLCAFEQLSRLKINFLKSEIFYFGDAKEMQENYSIIFRCQGGTYPFKYLETPMHHKRLSNSDWKIIEQKIERKLSS